MSKRQTRRFNLHISEELADEIEAIRAITGDSSATKAVERLLWYACFSLKQKVIEGELAKNALERNVNKSAK